MSYQKFVDEWVSLDAEAMFLARLQGVLYRSKYNVKFKLLRDEVNARVVAIRARQEAILELMLLENNFETWDGFLSSEN